MSQHYQCLIWAAGAAYCKRTCLRDAEAYEGLFDLVQEIKEEVEKRRRSEEGVASLSLSVAAPYVTRVAAELTYDFKDRCAADLVACASSLDTPVVPAAAK